MRVFSTEPVPRRSVGVAAPPALPDPVTFARTRLGFLPDEKQALVLASAAKRGILNCARQWGKSTVTAAKAVHCAYTRPGALVLVVSAVERQSRIFIEKAAGMAGKLGIARRGDGDNPASLLFPNGSRIIGLPGTEGTVRGFSAASLIVIDEASRVDDAMYMALLPMLAVGDGDLWMLSTPWGKRGFFHDVWMHGEGWEKVRATGPECARIPAKFLEQVRRDMGHAWFRQEYMGEFVTSGANVFDRDKVEAMFDELEESLLPEGMSVWQ